MGFARCSGILMPLSSLPGGYGIGSMGAPARKFVDFLAAAGQTIWQILPVGPTGYADSPYQSCSAFAGNPYFIDLDQLVKDGLLTRRDFAKIHWGGDAAHIDYGTLYEKRFDVLRKAYANFLKQRPVPGYDTPYPDDWYRFQFLSCEWLPDYCLYMAIKRDNGMVDWQQWPEALRLRDPAALAAFKEEHAEEVGFWAFVQYEFDRQWRALHAYAKSKGVSIMGDIPIYVAADSADAWAGRELFETDADGKPRRVAGCPPDYFAADGQLWGNPLYDWDYHRRTGYAWWIRRIRHALFIYDILRIDHFRGFDTYWAIPAGESTARNGRWENGPGMDLFRTLHNALGELPIVAEDLGEMFDSVRQGGVLETIVTGLPAGIGEPWFDSVESELAHLMFAVPACKGLEFGAGFAFASMRGSEANDPFAMRNGQVATATNKNGGINGGITNGMPLVFRTVLKPTPSIYKQQHTVDYIARQDADLQIKGRHDPCIVPRAAVVQNTLAAFGLLDLLTVRYGTLAQKHGLPQE